MMTTELPGLYIHVPFCSSKCPYCDFYSLVAPDELKDQYTDAIIKNIILYNKRVGGAFSTVYFGGGTPSLLGSKRLANILNCINRTPDCEVTVECNPSDLCRNWNEKDMESLAFAGANRISMGMQSAVDEERKALGRQADREQVKRAVDLVKSSGIDNFSLDLMLGIPHQTIDSIKESIEFCAQNGAKHVSSYLLKIEQGTLFEKVEKLLNLPDEDKCCDMYLAACECLKEHGYKQYEISNFAVPGYESRHNLIYWDCREYLGLGASAHSFYGGKRFYFERDIHKFIDSAQPISDGDGGSFEEYVMLRLRLNEGLQSDQVRARFGFDIPPEMLERARKFENSSLLKIANGNISLTPEGFLVSNAIIADLLN